MPPPLPPPLPPWPAQRRLQQGRQASQGQQARVGSLPKHTRHSIAVVTAVLKAEWEAQKKQNRQLLAMRERQQTLSQRPTTKKDTHRTAKLSHGTLNSLNAQAFRDCPSGGARGNRFTTHNLLKMGDASPTGTTTGCRLATKSETVRLRNHAKNCNTTQGNYNTTWS